MVRDGFVYWLDGNSETGVRVHRVAASGGDATLLSSGGSYTGTGIAVDTASIYWSASPGGGSGFVFKAPLSGGLAVQLTTDRVNQPSDIAIDSEFLYWAENNGGPDQNQGIRKVSLNGGSSITVTTLGYPLSLVLLGPDVHYSYTKTTADGGGSFIGKVSKDGGSVTDLTSTDSRASGMVVDTTYVYWAEFDTGTIKKMPLGGGPVTTLASGLNQPWRLAVDGFNVYWVEWANASPGAGAVRKTSLSGGEITTLATGLNGPNDIAVDSTAVYWSEYGTNRSDGAIKKLVLVDEVVPVVLVHGWAGSPASFGRMKELLESPAGGNHKVELCDYSDWTPFNLSARIEDIALRIRDDCIVAALNKWEAKRVDVIAHSMGGLAVRAWMADLFPFVGKGYAGEIRKLVLVGVPNYGAAWAKLCKVFGVACQLQEQQMEYGSNFLWDLHENWRLKRPIDPSQTLIVAGSCDGNTDSDGVVKLSSATLPLEFGDSPVRIIPYKHSSYARLGVDITEAWCPLNAGSLIDVDNRDHATFWLSKEFLETGKALDYSEIGVEPPDPSILQTGLFLVRLIDRKTQLPVVPSTIDFEGFLVDPGNTETNPDPDAGTITVVDLLQMADPGYNFTVFPQDGLGYILPPTDSTGVITGARPTVHRPIELDPGADLVVSNLSRPNEVRFTRRRRDVRLPIWSAVKYQGSATAGSSTTKLVLSTDTAIEGSDTVVGYGSARQLSAGEEASSLSVGVIPSGTRAGCYYLGAIADSADVVAETDDNNNTASVPLRVAEDLEIYTKRLPRGSVGVFYNFGLAVNGGIILWTWTLDGGALPSGLTLTPEGVIFGMPTTAGRFPFTVRVTDGSPGGPCPRATVTRSFTITIR